MVKVSAFGIARVEVDRIWRWQGCCWGAELLASAGRRSAALPEPDSQRIFLAASSTATTGYSRLLGQQDVGQKP